MGDGISFFGAQAVRRLAGVVALGWVMASAEAVTLYSTGFNNPPFDPTTGLWAGIEGWQASDPDNGSIGVTFEGGAVYIGGAAPAGPEALAWRNFLYDPVAAGNPIVNVRTRLGVVDSTNDVWDVFSFAIHNGQGVILCSFDFDNRTNLVHFFDGIRFVRMPGSFQNGYYFEVALTLDFSTQRASAKAVNDDGSEFPFFADLPFNAAGAAANFGQVAFWWFVINQGNPGNNALYIDRLSVEALPGPALAIQKGRRHRVRGPSYRLRGTQAAGDKVTVQVRAPGERRWKAAKGAPQAWSYPLKKLKPGRNVASVRLLNAVGAVIDQQKVTIIRR